MIALYPAVSLVSINPEGSHNHPTRDARALAQGRLSLLLALEVAPIGRATADPRGATRIDPADECGDAKTPETFLEKSGICRRFLKKCGRLGSTWRYLRA